MWQPQLDELVGSAEWLAEVELLVRRADGAIERIVGADCIATPVVLVPSGIVTASEPEGDYTIDTDSQRGGVSSPTIEAFDMAD